MLRPEKKCKKDSLTVTKRLTKDVFDVNSVVSLKFEKIVKKRTYGIKKHLTMKKRSESVPLLTKNAYTTQTTKTTFMNQIKFSLLKTPKDSKKDNKKGDTFFISDIFISKANMIVLRNKSIITGPKSVIDKKRIVGFNKKVATRKKVYFFSTTRKFNSVKIVTMNKHKVGILILNKLTLNILKIKKYKADLRAPMYGINIIGKPNKRLNTKSFVTPPNAAFIQKTSS